MRLSIAILITLIAVSSPMARIWYITPDGMGDAPTIQAGVDSSSPGDTVLVSQGTYTGFTERGALKACLFLKSGVTVFGEFGAPFTIIDMEQEGSGIGVVADSVSNTVFKGFTITGADPVAAYGLFGTGLASFDVVSCRFIGPGNHSWTWGARINAGGSAGISIDSCYFSGWGKDCYRSTYEHPAAVFWSQGEGVVRNSLFEQNDGPAILAHYSSLYVENNTIVDNAAGIAFRVVWSKQIPLHLDLITHNIITGNTCYGIACYSNSEKNAAPIDCDAWNDCECNDVWNNGTNYDLLYCDAPGNCGTSYPGKLQADPLFCDPENGDYDLQFGSPCTAENSPEGCGRIGAFPVGCPQTGTDGAPAEAGVHLAIDAIPNPFNAMLEIRLISPVDTEGRVEIVGVSGRRVRLLHDGKIAAGTTLFHWTGEDGSGAVASSGIYFIRVSTPEGRLLRKATLLR